MKYILLLNPRNRQQIYFHILKKTAKCKTKSRNFYIT